MIEHLNEMQAQPANLEDWPDWWLNQTLNELRDMMDSEVSEQDRERAQEIVSMAPSLQESHLKKSKSHAWMIQRPWMNCF
jgi:hypothetical protein